MLEDRLDALEKELSNIKQMICECAYALDPYCSAWKISCDVAKGRHEAAIKAHRYNQVQSIHIDKLANA